MSKTAIRRNLQALLTQARQTKNHSLAAYARSQMKRWLGTANPQLVTQSH